MGSCSVGRDLERSSTDSSTATRPPANSSKSKRRQCSKGSTSSYDVDTSVQAETKCIAGHSDLVTDMITARTDPQLRQVDDTTMAKTFNWPYGREPLSV